MNVMSLSTHNSSAVCAICVPDSWAQHHLKKDGRRQFLCQRKVDLRRFSDSADSVLTISQCSVHVCDVTFLHSNYD